MKLPCECLLFLRCKSSPQSISFPPPQGKHQRLHSRNRAVPVFNPIHPRIWNIARPDLHLLSSIQKYCSGSRWQIWKIWIASCVKRYSNALSEYLSRRRTKSSAMKMNGYCCRGNIIGLLSGGSSSLKGWIIHSLTYHQITVASTDCWKVIVKKNKVWD